MMDNMEKFKPCKGVVHTVELGDTLYKIAKKYDVKLCDLMKENPFINVYNLQPGDLICVPTAPVKPPMMPEEKPPKEKVYVVEAGDTLADVLLFFDTDYAGLARCNEDIANLPLQPGMVIKMPCRERSADAVSSLTV